MIGEVALSELSGAMAFWNVACKNREFRTVHLAPPFRAYPETNEDRDGGTRFFEGLSLPRLDAEPSYATAEITQLLA